MENKLKLTIVNTPCEEGAYTSHIKEMRGVVSEGEIIKEARENVLEALGIMLELEREESVFSDTPVNRYSEVNSRKYLTIQKFLQIPVIIFMRSKHYQYKGII